ncbi:hypothetical protein ACFLT1_03625 [Bacteroidota bacterium]
MKKIPLLVLLLCCFSGIIQAQETSWNKIFMLNTGVSVPYNDFATKTLTYHAGFASGGANLEGNFLWYWKWIGFEATLGYSNIFFAKNAYLSEYEEFLQYEGNTTVKAGSYQVIKSTAGFLLRVVEFNATEIQLNFQAGIALNVHPEIEVTNSLWGTLNSVPKDSDWQSISSVGFTTYHYFSDKHALVLNLNTNHTLPRFDDEAIWGRGFNLRIRYVNINLGLLIKL